jgi:HK97 family phage portal protein
MGIRGALNVRRFFAAAVAVLQRMLHPGGASVWSILNRTFINYAAKVRPDASSIVVSCIRWVQRNLTEAPLVLEQWVPEREEWAKVYRDDLLTLLDRPNPYYNWATLIKAVAADRMLSGTAYILKVRKGNLDPGQLWWAPETTIQPMWDEENAPGVFITHYEYNPGNGQVVNLREMDVIRMPDGMDPANPRKGLSPMRSLFREIFTDDEAANMTASLLSNMGVPGVIISPRGGRIAPDVAEAMKQTYMDKFTGDKKGEPMVLEGEATVQQFGFSPEQMQLRSLRGIPEERITAVLGVNAAVVGLGAGLATTKVGATLREYREEAFESTIIPLYREIASELTHQLLPDFKDTDFWRLAFDTSQVRVLQDDESKRVDRWGKMLESGAVLVAEYRRALGLIAGPEHQVYLRPRTLVPVPAGSMPNDQVDQSHQVLPNSSGAMTKTVVHDERGRIVRVIEEPRAALMEA